MASPSFLSVLVSFLYLRLDPQISELDPKLGWRDRGVELPNAKVILACCSRRFSMIFSSRSMAFLSKASFRSRSALSMAFRRSTTALNFSFSLDLNSSKCLLRSNSCCSRNFWDACACNWEKNQRVRPRWRSWRKFARTFIHLSVHIPLQSSNRVPKTLLGPSSSPPPFLWDL